MREIRTMEPGAILPRGGPRASGASVQVAVPVCSLRPDRDPRGRRSRAMGDAPEHRSPRARERRAARPPGSYSISQYPVRSGPARRAGIVPKYLIQVVSQRVQASRGARALCAAGRPVAGD